MPLRASVGPLAPGTEAIYALRIDRLDRSAAHSNSLHNLARVAADGGGFAFDLDEGNATAKSTADATRGVGRGEGPARAAGPTAVTSALRAEHGWGCPRTGPAMLVMTRPVIVLI